MIRRRYLLLSFAVGLSSIAGCLDIIEESAIADPPGQVDGDWQPDEVNSLSEHRNTAQSLAALSLTLEGCVDDLPALSGAPIRSTSTDEVYPQLSVAITGDLPDPTPTATALGDCTPISSDHDPYLAHPAAFIHDTNFDFAYLLCLYGDGLEHLEIEFIGTLPGDIAYVEVTPIAGNRKIVTLLRVGGWVDPAGVLVGITDSDVDLPSGVYEVDNASRPFDHRSSRDTRDSRRKHRTSVGERSLQPRPID